MFRQPRRSTRSMAIVLSLATLYAFSEPVALQADEGRTGEPSPGEVAVTEPSFALAPGWLERQQRTSVERWTKSDAEQVVSELAVSFQEVFSEHLKSLGLERVNRSDALEDLRLRGISTVARISIFDIDPRAPRHPSNSRTQHFAATDLSAAIRIEFVDAHSGEVVEVFEDRRTEGPPGTRLERSRHTSGRQAMRRLAKRWANELVEQLGRLPAARDGLRAEDASRRPGK